MSVEKYPMAQRDLPLMAVYIMKYRDPDYAIINPFHTRMKYES